MKVGIYPHSIHIHLHNFYFRHKVTLVFDRQLLACLLKIGDMYKRVYDSYSHTKHSLHIRTVLCTDYCIGQICKLNQLGNLHQIYSQ